MLFLFLGMSEMDVNLNKWGNPTVVLKTKTHTNTHATLMWRTCRPTTSVDAVFSTQNHCVSFEWVTSRLWSLSARRHEPYQFTNLLHLYHNPPYSCLRLFLSARMFTPLSASMPISLSLSVCNKSVMCGSVSKPPKNSDDWRCLRFAQSKRSVPEDCTHSLTRTSLRVIWTFRWRQLVCYI